MKAMLLAIGVILVVIGLFVYISRRDPDSREVKEAFTILKESSDGIPEDPFAVGYLNLNKRAPGEFNQRYSADQAIQGLKQVELGKIGNTVEGTILKQQYRLTQLDYKLAQIKRIGGDMKAEEFEKKRDVYAAATQAFQTFWDTKSEK